MGLSNLYVVMLGMGVVMFGLIGLVVICILMSKAVNIFESGRTPENAAPPSAAAAGAPGAHTGAALPGKSQEEGLKVAAAAALAEYIGCDFADIKIISMKAVSK